MTSPTSRKYQQYQISISQQCRSKWPNQQMPKPFPSSTQWHVHQCSCTPPNLPQKTWRPYLKVTRFTPIMRSQSPTPANTPNSTTITTNTSKSSIKLSILLVQGASSAVALLLSKAYQVNTPKPTSKSPMSLSKKHTANTTLSTYKKTETAKNQNQKPAVWRWAKVWNLRRFTVEK